MADSAPPSSDHQKLIDRLSNLPEHILLHIFSFLPTKDVVATSVLSKPWQHLWTLVPAIDLDDNAYRGGSGRQTFGDIVSKVLDDNKAQIIRRFRLKGMNFRTSSMHKWVSSATQRNVEELDLHFHQVFSHIDGRATNTFAFCCAPESCKTLIVMKLIMRASPSNDLRFVIGGHLDFPSLKVLHINTVGFETLDPSLSGFFPSRFPLLEELVVHPNIIHHDINISLPNLRRFKMDCFISKPVRKYILNIEAPGLQYLVLRNFVSGGFRVEHLPNLVEANVDVFYSIRDGKDEEYGESFIDFVNAVSDARRLILSLFTMQELRYSSSHMDRIQSFHNLVELDLVLDGSVLGITMIMLSKFKNLVHLKITEDGYDNVTKEGTKYGLKQPAHVPNCLTYHLKTFCFRYFRGSEYGTEFAKYILKKSLILENAKIRFGPRITWATGCHSHTILSTTSRGSSECLLEFEQISEMEHSDHEYRKRHDLSE